MVEWMVFWCAVFFPRVFCSDGSFATKVQVVQVYDMPILSAEQQIWHFFLSEHES